MTRLYAMMPYSPDMNLGAAYNDALEALPDDAWACFLDHDAMWTTYSWYTQIMEAITFKPDAGVFTAVTNRIASPWQQAGDRNNHDIGYHRAFGEERRKTRTLLDVTDTNGIGGVVLCISKETWRRIGGFVDGMMCVDHHAHFAVRQAGLRIWLIEGLYVYHVRRAFGEKHLRNAPKAKDCPCRGTDPTPSFRVTLP